MPIISDFDEILTYLATYIADSKKTEFKRHEITFNPKLDMQDFDSNNNTSENAIYFQLVSKLFLLHDMVGMSNKLISKCLIKKMKLEDCSFFLQYFKEKDFKLITNVICNLSDTKYVIALSNLSYEILDNLILSETITKALWYRYGSPMIIITKNVYQVQNHQSRDDSMKGNSTDNSEGGSQNFETQLLQLLSAVTNVNKDFIFSQSYTFWVFKINSLMFGVLIPRFESQKNCLINVWPIVPAASFFNAKKAISNLKISEKDKTIFYSIAASVKQNSKLNAINLKTEILNGITLPMLLQNRININSLYMTFFFEFLREKEHYFYPLPIGDSTVCLNCNHCTLTFNNIFQFVRHWWSSKLMKIFRCHMCDEKTSSLSKLASHYKNRHYNFIQNMRSPKGVKVIQHNTNSTTFFRNILSDQNENSTPNHRKCPFCNTFKDGLHYMRNHLKLYHLSEIMKMAVEKLKNNLPHYEKNISDFWKPNLPIYALDTKFKHFSKEQFTKIFNYNITCPFCIDSFIKFDDSLKFLTHIARDHCQTGPEKDETIHCDYDHQKSIITSSNMGDTSLTSNESVGKTSRFNSSHRDTSYFQNSTSKVISTSKCDTSSKSSQLTLSDFVDNLNLNDRLMLRNMLTKNLSENIKSNKCDQLHRLQSKVIEATDNQINCSICENSF